VNRLTLRPALALTAIALLAACNKAPDTNRSASGEVLEGTISDNMLPLDKVTSQPPLAEPTGTGKGARPGEAAGAGIAAADSGDGAADTAAPTPAADAPSAASGQ
jgi:hypothetical protein